MPFRDEPVRQRISVMDLSEWEGHESEEFLEPFFAFLHDNDGGFFNNDYCFILHSADLRTIKAINILAATYLGHGSIVREKCVAQSHFLCGGLEKTCQIIYFTECRVFPFSLCSL